MRGMSNGDWCCRVCRGPNGQAWRNWASKTHCHKCKAPKGKVHDAAATKQGCPTISKRQFEQKEAEISKLRRELAQAQGKVAKFSNQGQPPKEEPTEAEDPFSLEHYLKERAHYPDGHPMAGCLDGIIKTKRDEKLKKQPQSVTLAKADRQVVHKRAAVDKAEERLQSAAKQLKEAEAAKQKALEELQEAEEHRRRVVQELGDTSAEGLAPDKLVGDFRAVLEHLQEADFEQAGVAPEQAVAVFNQFGFLVSMAKKRLAIQLQAGPTQPAPAAAPAPMPAAAATLQGDGRRAAGQAALAAPTDPSQVAIEDQEDDEEMGHEVWAAIAPQAGAEELVALKARLRESGLWVRNTRKKGSRAARPAAEGPDRK